MVEIRLSLLRRVLIFVSQALFAVGAAFDAIGHKIFWLGLSAEKKALTNAIAAVFNASDARSSAAAADVPGMLVQPSPKDVQ